MVDKRELIRQVWCIARLFQVETEYVAPHTDRMDFGGLRSRANPDVEET